MKIIVGINNKTEVERLINNADEFYFGFSYIKNHRWMYSNQHFKNIQQAKQSIEYIKSKDKKIYFVANEIYPQQQFKHCIKVINKLIDSGIDGIITRDINIMKFFANKTKIILSSLALTFNNSSIEFYRSFNISRVILPQHLLPSEAKILIKNNLELEFEIFYFLLNFCRNIDGLCNFHTFLKVGTNCKRKFLLDHKKFLMPNLSWTMRRKLLYEYKKLGIKYVKLPRDGSVEERLKAIKDIKNIWKKQ